MGILDLFKKKEKTQTSGDAHDQLKEDLLDAIKRDHRTEFELLCRQNEARILKSFPQWKKTPEEYRGKPEAAQIYVNCLMIMANYFSRELKRDELHHILNGVDNSEEAQQWQAALVQVRKLMEEVKVQEAIPILEQCVEKARGLSGTVVATLLPLTLGHLGECYFQAGQAEKSVEPTERALQMVSEQGDLNATIAYLRNLYEIQRYQGNSDRAGAYAQQIADKLYEDGNLNFASNWRHQARAVGRGEPLLRVVVKLGDELFELDETPVVKNDKVEFMFMRNRFELRSAVGVCEAGKAMAEQGKADEAFALFEQAAALDKYNPTPHYFIAALRMHQRKVSEAIAAYEKTEQLAPGFESCRSELWLARKIAAGELDYDAYTEILHIVNEATPLEERVAHADLLQKKYPHFTECQYQKGKMLINAGQADEAMRIWEEALKNAEDPDVRSRLYTDMALCSQDKNKKLELVCQGRDVPSGNLIAHAMCSYLAVQLQDELNEQDTSANS